MFVEKPNEDIPWTIEAYSHLQRSMTKLRDLVKQEAFNIADMKFQLDLIRSTLAELGALLGQEEDTLFAKPKGQDSSSEYSKVHK